jgi:serine phosphatase RsbU (regulator of sigma subunit)
MLSVIMDEVQQFSAGKQQDDITLIVGKCRK